MRRKKSTLARRFAIPLLTCPACRGELQALGEESSIRCSNCGEVYGRDENGVWHLMPSAEGQAYQSFCSQYQSIREAEGWAGDDRDYYRRLPFVTSDDPQYSIWRMRQRSFAVFLSQVIEPREAAQSKPLRIVDAGAGNGWLANRLARRGHDVIAVDLQHDVRHGLGACRHYESSFIPVCATFDRLPLANDAVDVVVFNGSLHYTHDVFETVAETLRVLKRDGRLVVLDSPVYEDPDSGRRMVESRTQEFRDRYDVSSCGTVGKGFLMRGQLDGLADQFGLEWESIDPGFGLRRTLQRWTAALRYGRETAEMPVLVGSRSAGKSFPLPSAHERHWSVVQRLGHLWRWLRGLLFLRSRYDTFALESIRGYSLIVLPGVFNPALFDSSKWFVDLIEQGEIGLGARVLDMGTGAGLTAVAASAQGSDVTAVDINPAAVRSAYRNALLNGLADRIDVWQGDLFGPVAEERFDTIFFNPPFYEGTPDSQLDQAWRSTDIAERFAAGLKRHLSRSGKGYLILSSRGVPEQFLQAVADYGLHLEVFRTYDLISETQVVYRITHPDEGSC